MKPIFLCTKREKGKTNRYIIVCSDSVLQHVNIYSEKMHCAVVRLSGEVKIVQRLFNPCLHVSQREREREREREIPAGDF